MTLEDLFERENDRLVRELARRFDPESAADAMQEAWIIAARRWEWVLTRNHPAAWIRRVAYLRLISDRREQRRRREILEAAGAPVRVDLHADMLDFRRTLDQLPDRQRTAVCLADLGGWTVDEISEALGCSRRMVNKYLWAARQQLRSGMDNPPRVQPTGTPGERLREVLAERSMSQSMLASKMDRPGSIISGIINGRKRITPETANQLEQALGIPAEEWLTTTPPGVAMATA